MPMPSPTSQSADVAPSKSDTVLSVRNLRTGFRTDRGPVIAVDGVSFDLYQGECLGIVGESGCGKSVTSKSIMRLLPPRNSFIESGSEVLFEGKNLVEASDREMRDVRGNQIAMIFQEPMTALNPVFTVGWQIDEALRIHTSLTRIERRTRAIEMLRTVEIPNPDRRYDEYPHQLSGGMRQRVVIAMALCCEPQILLADEPTTALDVTIQNQVLKLMNDLRKRLKTAIVMITHDLGVVAQMCDRVVVMYAGQVVEIANVYDLFHAPRHPYTKALLDSIPRTGRDQHQSKLPTIDGMVPSLFELPQGCRFSNRCQSGQDRCCHELPDIETTKDGRSIRCFFPVENRADS